MYGSFLLLDIITYFKSGNTTSAAALKDSLFISSPPKVFWGAVILAKMSDINLHVPLN